MNLRLTRILLLTFALQPIAAQVTVSEDFDGMGASGTATPSGWTFISWSTGSNSTWTDSVAITGPSITGGTTNSTLTAANDPSGQKSSSTGYNFGLSTSSSDRCFGTSPTNYQGVALQWTIANSGLQAVTAIQIGYHIRRFTAPATANEVPGYWLFYSLDNGASWTNVSALNPTLSGSGGVVVPNSTGTTTVAATTITLNQTWAAGSNLILRWVDDNAEETSPDQILGLDEVSLQSTAYAIGNAPIASITSPAADTNFIAPATVSIEATAIDIGGTITKVDFYQDTTLLGTDTTSPYAYSWTNVPIGSYTLTARATDNDGNVSSSSTVPITVSQTLTRQPYLQQAAPTTMTLRWRSANSYIGRVKYGASNTSLNTTVDEASSKTDHEITLTGLTPNTKYFYSVGNATDVHAGADTDHHFTTPPAANSTPETRIWVLGDAGTATANQINVRNAFTTWTGSRDPNFVLQLGDNAYETGTDAEYQSKVFDVYGSMMRRVPFWSCLGNHDTGGSAAFVDTYPYFNIYTFPKSAECGGVASGTEHYYSFDYGNIHVISLDSMTASKATNGAMATWLTSDLAATTKTWIICIFHHPPYTKGSHNSDTETALIQMRTNFLPILEAGGVDLVLCGHSHSYERSYLLDGHYGLSTTLTADMKKNGGDGRPAGNGAYMKPLTGPRDHFGAVYAVPGSSGKISGGTLDHPAHFISLNNLGSLVIDISGTRLDATFVRENGTQPDTFTIIKKGPADSDSDGIADAYEITYSLDRHDAADALLDSDQDGLNNLAEYLFGLNPGTSDRFQWTTTLDKETGNMTVSFPTLGDRSYRVKWSENLFDWYNGSSLITGDGTSKVWIDDGSVTGSVPGSAFKRFYRVEVGSSP